MIVYHGCGEELAMAWRWNGRAYVAEISTPEGRPVSECPRCGEAGLGRRDLWTREEYVRRFGHEPDEGPAAAQEGDRGRGAPQAGAGSNT